MQEQAEHVKCLLSFAPESFAFPSSNQKQNDQHAQTSNFARCFLQA
jgi:hypothetical protein